MHNKLRLDFVYPFYYNNNEKNTNNVNILEKILVYLETDLSKIEEFDMF